MIKAKKAEKQNKWLHVQHVNIKLKKKRQNQAK